MMTVPSIHASTREAGRIAKGQSHMLLAMDGMEFM